MVFLTKAIHKNLGLEGSSLAARPSSEPARVVRSELKEDIVIVGQAVHLPGDINNAESLWKAPIDHWQRDDIMTPIPEARWDHKSFYRSPDSKVPPATCDITLDKAGFVELAGFDLSFFDISSAEAFHVSPNIRLSMEIAFEALENVNIPILKIKGSDMGVFVAAGMDEGCIKLLFADKGWGGLCLLFRVVTHHLTFPTTVIYQILWNRCCYKHGLWSDQLVSIFLLLTIEYSPVRIIAYDISYRFLF